MPITRGSLSCSEGKIWMESARNGKTSSREETEPIDGYLYLYDESRKLHIAVFVNTGRVRYYETYSASWTAMEQYYLKYQ